MNPISLLTYLFYVAASVALTLWVGRTLHRNGRVFIVDSFGGNDEKADAVNHLLLVGFYLVNFGFVALFLKYGTKPTTVIEGIEYIATKVGIVLLVLGGMHFFNMFNIAKMGQKARRHAEPPLLPANN